ncbi:MAG: hypothetical protein AB7V48_14190 [Sedimentibacter sp.]
MKNAKIIIFFIISLSIVISGCSNGEKELIEAKELLAQGKFEDADLIMDKVKNKEILNQFEQSVNEEYSNLLKQAEELIAKGKFKEATSIMGVVDNIDIYKQFEILLNEEYIKRLGQVEDLLLVSFDEDKAAELMKGVTDSKVLTEYDKLLKKANEPEIKYNKAMNFITLGNNREAMKLLIGIYDYKDAQEQYFNILLDKRIASNTEGEYFVMDNGKVRVFIIGDDHGGSGEKAAENWSDIKAISAHAYGLVGLQNDGQVVATSDNGKRSSVYWAGAEVLDGDWSNIKQIACGAYHTVGLKQDGTVKSTKYKGVPDYNFNQDNVNDWKDIVMIAAGDEHTIGLKKDGSVVAVGNNEAGQCDVTLWTDVVSISANGHWSVGLQRDGTLLYAGGTKEQDKAELINALFSKDPIEALKKVKYSWNHVLEINNWHDIVSVSVGFSHITALRSDGTVRTTGSNNNGECNTLGWTDMVCSVAGGSITMGVSSEGKITRIGIPSFLYRTIDGFNLFSGQ